MKINKYEFGHMTNMAAMPVYGKVKLTISMLMVHWTVFYYDLQIHFKKQNTQYSGERLRTIGPLVSITNEMM